MKHFKYTPETLAKTLTQLLVFVNAYKKDLQAHGYRCSFHPEVLNIVSTGKRVRLTTVLLNPKQQQDLKRSGV
jgi:hypothetical protein